MRDILFWISFFLGAALLAACAGGASGGGSGAGADKGSLAVSLTDASGCDFDGVFVTVQKVRVHQSASATEHDAGWIDIALPNGPVQINLLTLQNGLMTDLGLAPLPPGHYTQVRLLLAPNDSAAPPFKNYVTIGGQAFPLNIPSGFVNGIKLHHEFEIKSGEKEELILDCDACRSIAKAKDGSYYLRPNILVVRRSDAGRITGAVDAASSGAVVKAEINGYVYKQTRIKPDGSFILYPLPNSDTIKTLYPQDTAGTFDVVIVSDATTTVVTTDVPVAAGGETVLSLTTQPTPLPISATGVLTGHIDPTGADARVRRTINGKPYQIRRDSVDLADGSFEFLLATAAPRYGSYTTTLPISYQENAAAAANYTVDTPNDDGLYQVSAQSVTVSGTTPTSVDFTGASRLAPTQGTAGTVSGTLTISALPPGGASGTILVSATMEDENINSAGVPVSASGVIPFTLDDLAPGTYQVTILSSKGFTQIIPTSMEVTIPPGGGTFANIDFTLAP